ncbi:hypothetical protein EH240_22140 [Mesorhizobium tamadayense]|uniref:Sel1 repeat family protein n=1 Tax=Mesorhizobium tamadayense TaxID=425306 RepID=A0A3P3FDC6_9HYPH|nr:hypothetical protein [Mesorhizobium tamadayense]RRH96683.1 hypothetical protein EH240_22140 [Mesorhizobium tamadayense]
MAYNQNQDAFSLYRSNRYTEAYQPLLDMERQGSLEATFCLAYMYQEGLGVAKDIGAALSRYRSLGNNGVPRAWFYAGALLEQMG